MLPNKIKACELNEEMMFTGTKVVSKVDLFEGTSCINVYAPGRNPSSNMAGDGKEKLLDQSFDRLSKPGLGDGRSES